MRVFEWKDYQHQADNNGECDQCWGSVDYPVKCDECKDGYVHAEFEEESYDNVYLSYQCDTCDNDSNPY